MTGKRFVALDSLRGICAVMVVLLHLNTNGYIANATVVRHGSLFVDFFFVLSGFVISASYRDRLAAGFSIAQFMALRLGRIYPLHAVMLIVFFLFELLLATHVLGRSDRTAFTGPFDIRWLMASFLLVQTFFGPDQTTWNGPSWSIAVEMWTYLVYAGLYRWFRSRLVPLSIAIAAVACLYLAGLTDRYLSVNHDGALARCLYGFASGSIAYAIFDRLPNGLRLRGLVATTAECAVVALTLLMVAESGPTPLSLVMPVIFLAVVTVFAQQAGFISILLQSPPFTFLGILSYSIYMVHGFIMYRLVNVLYLVERLTRHRWNLVGHNSAGGYHVAGSPLFGDIMSLLLVLMAVTTAYVSYKFVERPAQDRIRDFVAAHADRRSRRAESEAMHAGF